MLEQFREILDKIPAMLLLAAILGYLGYGHYVFVTDPASPLLQKQAQVVAAENQKKDLQAKLKAAQEFFLTLEKRRLELRALAKELEGLKVTLSETMDIGGLIKSVVTEAGKVGLTVSGIKPTDLKESEYYSEQAFAMGFHGVYVQLVVFLERLANLEKIIRVDDFNMSVVSSPTAQYVELEGVLQLKSYRYKASKADDLGKDSTPATKAAPSTVPSASNPAAAAAPVMAPAPVGAHK
jgi:Tfp pilus assembly protein PilO